VAAAKHLGSRTAENANLFLDEIAICRGHAGKATAALLKRAGPKARGDNPIKVNVARVVRHASHLEDLVKQIVPARFVPRFMFFPLVNCRPCASVPRGFSRLIAHCARQVAAQNG